MPACMWASTTPGKARRPLASCTSLACFAGMSPAIFASLPPLMAMSAWCTAWPCGRTTCTFLMTRSHCLAFAIPSSLFFVSLAELEHLRRADDAVEALQVEHAIAQRRRGAIALQSGEVLLRGENQTARQAAGEDAYAIAELLQAPGIQHRRLAALDHVCKQRHAGSKALGDGFHFV